MSGQKQIMIFTVCPSCYAAYKIPDVVLGKEVTCKRCRSVFNVEKFVTEEKCPPLAKIAVEKQLIKDKTMVEAMAILSAEKKAGKSIRIEDILLEKKMISKEVLDNLIVATTRFQDKEFGNFAVKQNFVAKENIDEALDIQARHFKKTRRVIPVSEILLEKRLISEEECDSILKQQARFAESSCLNGTQNGKSHEKQTPQGTEPGKERPSSIGENEITDAELKVRGYQDKKFFKIRQMDKEYIKLAIDHNFITKQEGDDILAKQLSLFEKTKKRRIVGDILVALNFLTREKRDFLLIKQKRIDEKDIRFCSIAVEKAYISFEIGEKIKSKLRDHLDDQKEKFTAGQLCLSENILTPEQCTEITEILTSAQEDAEAENFKTDKKYVINGIEFRLQVTKDGLQAFLVREEDLPETFTVSDVKDFLIERKIAYGIVDDSLIEGFIRYEGHKNQKFKIAEGKPVKLGRDTVIKYHFDTDHLKVGALQQGGKIDFKDRGEIPHVSKGDLIAEKIPMIQGEQGIDVFAHPVPIPEMKDPSLRAGKGVKISDDGLKVYATVDGQPDAALNGKISVLQELHIPGDVGFETGHVEFDGNVNVSGVIQDGFRVRAANLKAMEIMGGDIQTTGDITAKGGVTGAEIRSQGNVIGKYFSNATISALGDVIAQKQIIDSKIDTSGTVIVKSGKIISSEIIAGKGIQTKQIGTDISVPCKLQIGVDISSEKELTLLNNRISELTEQKNTLLKENDACKEAENQSHVDIATLAQVQDRAMVEQRSLETQLAELKQKGDDKAAVEVETAINALAQKAKSADDEISALFEKQDKLAEDQANLTSRLKELDDRIQEIHEEKKAILMISKENTEDAYIKVSHLLYEGTSVTGAHSKLILRKSLNNGKIKEVRVGHTGSDSDWEMRVMT